MGGRSSAVATWRRRGRASDGSGSSSGTAISGSGGHRDTIARRQADSKKNTYLGDHAICASSQVTGLGWASVWLSRQELPIGYVKRAAARPDGFHRREYWHSPESAKHCCGALVRGRAEDKLGMIVLCAQSGRGLDGFGASFPPPSAEPAHGEH